MMSVQVIEGLITDLSEATSLEKEDIENVIDFLLIYDLLDEAQVYKCYEREDDDVQD